jgi:sugar lactone lactonase YvrE
MIELQPFKGEILCRTGAYHGEGPTYDPGTDTAYWFSIGDCQLHELHLGSGRKVVHTLPFMASVLARIDDERQLLVSEHGLHIRMKNTGALDLVTPIETDRPEMRSNDGRCHPSGALWFGTMSKTGENRKGAGAIYHIQRGEVTVLYTRVSIPNGICFSPDGRTGYFVDTFDNLYRKVALDPHTGLPVAEPELFSDESGAPGGVDGSVCAADGSIFNARWGVGEIHHYAPDGRKIGRYKLPPKQTTCPAFIGRDADRLLVTTARENLSRAEWDADPEAGYTYELGIGVKGVFDAAYRT